MDKLNKKLWLTSVDFTVTGKKHTTVDGKIKKFLNAYNLFEDKNQKKMKINNK